MRTRLAGLYVITPEDADTERLAARVAAALAGGARAVQYRNKSATRALARVQLARLASLTRPAGALLIVNDSVELAIEAAADGVHLGADDGELAAARARLPEAMLLGASCYDRLALAEQAAEAGADYVAFGSVFASPTKPHAVHAPLELFGLARARLDIATCAIGGIDAHNARAAIEAGADSLAVISAVFDAPDVTAAAAAIVRQFDRAERPAR